MRSAQFFAVFGATLLVSCSNRTLAHLNHSAGKAPLAQCDPSLSGAIVVRRNDARTVPKSHTVIASSSMTLMEAKRVEGPCARDIVNFIAGNARITTGDIFVIWDDGRTTFHRRSSAPTDEPAIAALPASLAGYDLVSADRIRLRDTPAGRRESYIGLFKRKSDHIIARFDNLNGKPSGNAELLIRAKSPISSMDFLPAPDSADGRIGFVQPDARGVWLYGYDWHYGALQPLQS